MRGHNICTYAELTNIIPYYHQILPLICLCNYHKKSELKKIIKVKSKILDISVKPQRTLLLYIKKYSMDYLFPIFNSYYLKLMISHNKFYLS